MTHNLEARPRILLTFALPVVMGFLLALIGGCDFSFGASFDDETQSILAKPEILSIVLDPPEAGPGETVRASFLVADEAGPLRVPVQLWALADSMEGLNPARAVDDGSLVADGDAAQDSGDGLPFDPETMGFLPVFEFETRDEDAYTFNANDQAVQLVTLLVAFESLDLDDLSGDDAAAQLDEMMARDAVKMAFRTLVVSRTTPRNRNPEVVRVTARLGEDGEPVPLTLVHPNAPDLTRARGEAALNPYVYTICASKAKPVPPKDHCPNEKIFFNAEEVTDDGEEADLRFQWITLAGDFEGRRDRDQRWNVPCYQDLPSNPPQTPDPERPEDFNPRLDPNLYPVFLIVRDNGAEDRLGQVWTEFYVRLVLAPDC